MFTGLIRLISKHSSQMIYTRATKGEDKDEDKKEDTQKQKGKKDKKAKAVEAEAWLFSI